MLFVVAKIKSPDFLNVSYFAEVHHGALLLVRLPAQRMLAVSASGSAPECLHDLNPIDPERLSKLLKPGKAGRVSIVSTQNTNLGSRVVRRRTISAPSIADVPPILDEHGHIVASVIGYNGTAPRVVDPIAYEDIVEEDFAIRAALSAAKTGPASANDLLRRYIGIASGRVSEHGPPLRIAAFRDWVASLAKQMKSDGVYSEVFDRYAATAKAQVRDGAPLNLLLDIMDLADQYRPKDSIDELRGDDLCVDRVGNPVRSGAKFTSDFNVVLNDKAIPVEITFNAETQRYRLDSPKLDDEFVRTDGLTRPLSRALNEAASFSVIPEDKSVIYVHGRFYAPGLKFGNRFSEEEFFVGHCLYPSATFKDITSEKGCHVIEATDAFDPKSLFSLIDGWKDGLNTATLNILPWRYRPISTRFGFPS